MSTSYQPWALIPDTIDPDEIERIIKRVQGHHWSTRSPESRAQTITRRRERRQALREAGIRPNYHKGAPDTPHEQPAQKPKLTKTKVAILLAVARGFRVTDEGRLVNKRGRILTPRKNRRGLLHYQIHAFLPDHRLGEKGAKVNYTYSVAKLAAYQRWGDTVFTPGIYIRYRDGNQANVAPSNLFLSRKPVALAPVPPRSGTPIAKSAGKQQGRPPSLSWAQVQEFRRLMDTGQATYGDLAKHTGKSRSFFSLLRRNLIYREESAHL